MDVVSKKTRSISLNKSRRCSKSSSSIQSLVQRGVSKIRAPGWSLSGSPRNLMAPALRGPITTRGKQAVHHGQIDGPFDVELVAARLQRPLEGRSQLQGLPQAAKDQIRTDPSHLHRLGLARGMRIDDGQFLAEAKTRTHQRIQLPRGLERVQPPDRAQHALVHLAQLAKAFDDLQVGVGAGAFDSKIHRAISFPLLTSAQYSSNAIENRRTSSEFGTTF